MLKKLILMGAGISFLLFSGSGVIKAQDQVEAKKQEILELQSKLQVIYGQKQTLAKAIDYLNIKMQLTQKQIESTQGDIKRLEDEINSLSGKIVILNANLGKLSSLLINRIHFTYMLAAEIKPIYNLLAGDDFGSLIKRQKYLQAGQLNDRKMMFELEKTKTNFDEQKAMKEKKQVELELARKKLESQKLALNQQQKEKSALFTVTRNDEKKYQEQLLRAMAELEAIQSIIAGKGSETEVKKIGEGEVVASVISTISACSNGPHLHFEVAKNGVNVNPADYLSGKSVVWDNKPDGMFSFNGSWRWPVNEPIRITQGYGMTFYAGTLRYYGGNPHTGIDMINDNKNYQVYAVKTGVLYRGAIGCGGGTLRYVRIKQDDGIDTYYLHVNY